MFLFTAISSLAMVMYLYKAHQIMTEKAEEERKQKFTIDFMFLGKLFHVRPYCKISTKACIMKMRRWESKFIRPELDLQLYKHRWRALVAGILE